MPRSPGGRCPRWRSFRLLSSFPARRWRARSRFVASDPLDHNRRNLVVLMCGIVAVLRRSSGRMPPDGVRLLRDLQQTAAALGPLGGADHEIVSPDFLARVAA